MKRSDDKEFIVKEVEIVIDRTLETKHPKYGFIYIVNYGYVPNVRAICLFIREWFELIESYKGKCIAVIHRTNDDDKSFNRVSRKIFWICNYKIMIVKRKKEASYVSIFLNI